MSAEKEIRKLQQKNQEYHRQILNLQEDVTKWSRYCAYVAGGSLGIILFLLVFATPEKVECEVCEVCEACETCPPAVECPPPVECPEVKAQKETIKQTPKQTTTAAPTDVDSDSFPRAYIIQPGDNFSTISQKIYGRASWAQWLADQNGIDPSRLQIGQEITLPAPKN
jgi:hypothetical protein